MVTRYACVVFHKLTFHFISSSSKCIPQTKFHFISSSSTSPHNLFLLSLSSSQHWRGHTPHCWQLRKLIWKIWNFSIEEWKGTDNNWIISYFFTNPSLFRPCFLIRALFSCLSSPPPCHNVSLARGGMLLQNIIVSLLITTTWRSKIWNSL